MEEENQIKSIIIVAICIFVVTAIFVGGYIITKMHNTSNNSSNNELPKETNISYEGVYETFVTIDGTEYFSHVILREDKTFVITTPTFIMSQIVGTYEVDKNGITFNEKVFYYENSCYDNRVENLQSFKAQIVNGNDIVLFFPTYGEYLTENIGRVTYKKIKELDNINSYRELTINPEDSDLTLCNINNEEVNLQ